MKAKIWLAVWLTTVILSLGIIGSAVYYVDPYFHYHKPHIDRYYYSLDNQRYQNDGICRFFDYEMMISGSSMVENFKSSEAEQIYGYKCVKCPFTGSSYKEVNDNIKKALKANPDLKLVIRGLDMAHFFDDRDFMRTDMGTYPTYLYDNNIFNDVNYLFNRDVLFGRVYNMQKARSHGKAGGIDTFDDYSRWQESAVFGADAVFAAHNEPVHSGEESHLSEEEKQKIYGNISANVTSVADDNPDVEFYYFIPPYSVVFWSDWNMAGTLYKQLEAEYYITDLIISHPNIHMFSFNNLTEITTDLDNYKDAGHYSADINSMILSRMHNGDCQITTDNHDTYFRKEYDFYTTYDYSEIYDRLNSISD